MTQHGIPPDVVVIVQKFIFHEPEILMQWYCDKYDTIFFYFFELRYVRQYISSTYTT